jgi:hypothetical protein
MGPVIGPSPECYLSALSSRLIDSTDGFQVTLDCFEFVPEMLQQQVSGQRSISLFQSCDDQLMFTHRGDPSIMIHLVRQVACPQQAGIEILVGPGQNWISRGGYNLGMNCLLSRKYSGQITPQKGRLHLAMNGVEIADFCVRNIFAC